MKKNPALTAEYAEKMRPLIPMAQKAYGSKSQNTPAHQASKQYTQLLVEYTEKGGSLIHLARELEVSYAGIRRRVFTSSIPAMDNKTARKKIDPETLEAAVARVREAKAAGTSKYHEQLAHEYYTNGISLSAIAKGLGIANAGPLYYGVQRHIQKTASV